MDSLRAALFPPDLTAWQHVKDNIWFLAASHKSALFFPSFNHDVSSCVQDNVQNGIGGQKVVAVGHFRSSNASSRSRVADRR